MNGYRARLVAHLGSAVAWGEGMALSSERLETPALPSFAETWREQDDLTALCADRPSETREIFSPNAFYGNDFILKRYAQMASDRSLLCVVPHGVEVQPRVVWAPEFRARLPAILSFSTVRQRIYRSLTRKIVLPSASPYVYVGRLLDALPPSERARQGTIFFVSHSTHHLRDEVDVASLARTLRSVDDRWQPVTVCIYWKDFLLGRHRPFEEMGLRVVSAGHIFDPLFLFRLHHLCSGHEFASGNEIGSHIIFSVHSGCEYVHFAEVEVPTLPADVDVPEQELVAAEDPLVESPDLIRIFFGRETDFSLQAKAAAYYLGYENELSSDDLRSLLLGLEGLDRWGFAKLPQGRKAYLPPARVNRGARALAKRSLGRAN